MGIVSSERSQSAARSGYPNPKEEVGWREDNALAAVSVSGAAPWLLLRKGRLFLLSLLASPVFRSAQSAFPITQYYWVAASEGTHTGQHTWMLEPPVKSSVPSVRLTTCVEVSSFFLSCVRAFSFLSASSGAGRGERPCVRAVRDGSPG